MVFGRGPLILAFVATWLGSTGTASSECIRVTGDAPIDRMNGATKVFVADVRAIEDSGQRVVFDVLEGFKGVHPGRLAVQVYLEVHGFTFQAGQRVLVYGYPAPEAPELLSTTCSATRLVTMGDKELVILRRLAKK